MGDFLMNCRSWVNTNNFMHDPATLKMGVLITNERQKSNKTQQKMLHTLLFDHADREGTVSMLAHLKFNRESKKGDIMYRSGMIVSSRANLCSFVAATFLNETNKKSHDLLMNGLFWDQSHKEDIFPHPYVDVDLKLKGSELRPFREWYGSIGEAIQLLCKQFEELGGGVASNNTTLFGATRVCENLNGATYTKYSVHCHWPDLVCQSTILLGQIVSEVNAVAPRLPTTDDAGLIVEGTELVFDTKVYNARNQLFRLPFCGKSGELKAALFPFETKKNPDWVYKLSDTISRASIASFVNKSCTHTNNPSKYIMIQREITPGPAHAQSRAFIQSGPGEMQDNSKWLDFMGPIIDKIVLPKWVAHRQRLMHSHGVSGRIPQPDKILLASMTRIPTFTASFQYEPKNDCFCEYDTRASSPYLHRPGAVTYIVDVQAGKIAQNCFNCRGMQGFKLKWTNFINVNSLAFDLLPAEDQYIGCCDFVSVKPFTPQVKFFMTFCEKDICFVAETKTVMAYDQATGVWHAGSDGNRIILALIDEMNEKYHKYAMAFVGEVTKKLNSELEAMELTATEKLKKKKKIKADCFKKIQKIGGIWAPSLEQRRKLTDFLVQEACPHRVETMEPFAHLVPLLDCKAINVYTWLQVDIKREHYFTSRLNATIINEQDETMAAFKEWQLQVCSGDKEYMEWKLQVMGLSLTMFIFDRAVYCPLGPKGRNGKSSEIFLFSEITQRAKPHRGMFIGREYLTKGAQDRKNAAAPDTTRMMMQDKTVLIVDECREAPVDGALVKSLVSGDKTSARNLYEKETTNVQSKGSLWMISNKVLPFDYEDIALCNRLRIMPYDAVWVTDVAATNTTCKNDIKKAMYVFQEDASFKENKLSMWGDAMTTTCLFALHVFFKLLPRDPADPTRPLKLQSLPIPACVKKLTEKVILSEHELLSFVKEHLAETKAGQKDIRLDVAWYNFRVFSRNKTGRPKIATLTKFEGALGRADMIIKDPNMSGLDKYIEGYYLAKEAISLEKIDGQATGLGYCEFVRPASSTSVPLLLSQCGAPNEQSGTKAEMMQHTKFLGGCLMEEDEVFVEVAWDNYKTALKNVNVIHPKVTTITEFTVGLGLMGYKLRATSDGARIIDTCIKEIVEENAWYYEPAHYNKRPRVCVVVLLYNKHHS
jgi:hypothetical protein